MGRTNYSHASTIGLVIGEPLYRYIDYEKTPQYIKSKKLQSGSIENNRISYDVVNDVITTYNINIQDPNEVIVAIPTIKFRGSKYLHFYSDSIFMDPGVIVTDGTLVNVEYNVEYDNFGNMIPGEYYIQYTAENSNKYKVYLSRIIYVRDVTTIQLRGANPYYIENGFDVYVEPGAYTTNGDIDNANISSTVNNTVNGEYFVTYSYTDSEGNTYSRKRTVIVRDITKPVLSVIGQRVIYLERYTGVYDDSSYGAVSDGGEAVITSNNINITRVGIYSITYRSIDGSGNVGSAVRRVVVKDTTPPVITPNGDNTVYFDRGSGPYIDSGAVSDGNETVTSVITDDTTGLVVDSINTDVLGEYSITYTASDPYNNVGIARRRVIVRDVTGPRITLNGDSIYRIIKDVDTYTEYGATADGNEEITIQIKDSNNTVIPEVPTSVVGIYKVIYTAVDEYGNYSSEYRNVIVKDGNSPIVTLIGNQSITIEKGNGYFEQGAIAYDNEDDAFLQVIINGSVDVNTVGVYTINYTSYDSDLNAGLNSRTVTVVDTTPPIIELNGTPTVNVEREDTGEYTDPYATTPEIGVTISSVITDSRNRVVSSINKNSVGEYRIKYIATDTFGNQSSIVRTVIVKDTTAPVIDIIGDVSYDVNLGKRYEDPGVTTDGNEAVTTVIRNSADKVISSIDTNIVENYTITYTAIDSYGNRNDVTRTVNIINTIPPIMSFLPNPISMTRGDIFYPERGVSINKGYYTYDVSGFNRYKNGEYSVRYKAVDSIGNTAYYTRIVIVRDRILASGYRNLTSTNPLPIPTLRQLTI